MTARKTLQDAMNRLIDLSRNLRINDSKWVYTSEERLIIASGIRAARQSLSMDIESDYEAALKKVEDAIEMCTKAREEVILKETIDVENAALRSELEVLTDAIGWANISTTEGEEISRVINDRRHDHNRRETFNTLTLLVERMKVLKAEVEAAKAAKNKSEETVTSKENPEQMKNAQNQLLSLFALAAAAAGQLPNGVGFGQAMPQEPVEPDFSKEDKLLEVLGELQALALSRDTTVLTEQERDAIKNVVRKTPEVIASANGPRLDIITSQIRRAIEVVESCPIRTVSENISPANMATALEKLTDLHGLLVKHGVQDDLVDQLGETVKFAPVVIGDTNFDQKRLNEVIMEDWSKAINLVSETDSISLDDLKEVLEGKKKEATVILGGRPTTITDLPNRADLRITLGNETTDTKPVDPIKDIFDRVRASVYTHEKSNENSYQRKNLENGLGRAQIMRDLIQFQKDIPLDILKKLKLQLSGDEACECEFCVALTEEAVAPALDAVTQYRGRFATSTDSAPALDAVAQVRARKDVPELVDFSPEAKDKLNREAVYVDNGITSEDNYLQCRAHNTTLQVFQTDMDAAKTALNELMNAINPAYLTPAIRKTFKKLLSFAAAVKDAGAPVSVEMFRFENRMYRDKLTYGVSLAASYGSGKDLQTTYLNAFFLA